MASRTAPVRPTKAAENPGRRHFIKLSAIAGAGLAMPSLAFSMHGARRRTERMEGPDARSILVIYLTRTNNTKAAAEIIQQATGGTLLELETATPYPEDYDAIVAQVAQENERGYLPPLKTTVPNLADYDTVFLGFPTWGMKLPPPMKSLLQAHDWKGRTVVPFNTNAGYGSGSSFDTVTDLCSGAKVLEGFSTRGGIERDGILLAIHGERRTAVRTEVLNWLQRIGIPATSR